jgi:hypothetical protein
LCSKQQAKLQFKVLSMHAQNPKDDISNSGGGALTSFNTRLKPSLCSLASCVVVAGSVGSGEADRDCTALGTSRMIVLEAKD